MGFACRLCGSGGHQVLMGHTEFLDAAQRFGDARTRMGEIVSTRSDLGFGDLVRCDGCGLHSVATPPGPAALGAFYQAYYANENYGAKQDKKIARARGRLQRLKRTIRGRQFLDVGCNLGFAAEAARLEGFSAHGIEIDAAAVTAGQRLFPALDLRCMSVEALANTGEVFDLVWCTEVLEHAIDFRSFATALAAVVAPGGAIFLTTPDAGHWRRGDFVGWDEVKPPEHLQWFEARHLRQLFEPLGFSVGFWPALKPNLRMLARRPG